jgi:hypothetical protein
MGDITEDEYNALGLQDALDYDSVTKYVCATYQCDNLDKECDVDSRTSNNAFVYADKVMESGVTSIRHVPSNTVCPKCMTVMKEISTEYFKSKDEDVYRVYAKKAKGDRSKDYFKDFSVTKSVATAEPGVGQDSTKLTKKDIANFERNMNNK